ncbi:MAG TPA: hypothetical protein VN708_21705 [Terriglobales bacterium]|jgi:hypothetical protein|nr:hypothetical protein [Terriglobales bacterium]
MAHLRITFIVISILAAALVCPAQESSQTLSIVYRDGHQKSIAMPSGSRIDFNAGNMTVSHGSSAETIRVSDVARIDFSSGRSIGFGVNHFVGKWEFGTGVGSQTFFVTLDRDGRAHKTIGSPHGTWTVSNGEARIKWDDGWTDVIRKVGNKHQKFAYEKGRSLNDQPSNVAEAKTLNSEPI